MKTAAVVLSIFAGLTASSVALADEPGESLSPPRLAPETPEQHAENASEKDDSAPPIEPQTVTTTTITGAEIAAPGVVPPPLPRERDRDTITLRQSFRPHRPLLYTGAAMFIASYASTAALTVSRDLRDQDGDPTLYLPVAGPWLHLANSNETALNAFLIASSGILQGAGVALSALSLVVPERVPAATIQAGGVKVNLSAATLGRGAAGLGAVGTF